MKQLRLRKTMPTSGTFVAVWKTANGTHAEGFKWINGELYMEVGHTFMRLQGQADYFKQFDADADLTFII